MASIVNRIYPLDTAAQVQIKSSVRIVSLDDVIIELVKNALDAQATKIQIVLSYSQGYCSVLDDGHGIPAEEFRDGGRLAQPYCTSKITRTDFTYGKYGLYLSALAGVSLISITSRTESDQNASVFWCDDSGGLGSGVQKSDTLETKTGTRVKVYNLFSKLPVRRKHLADRFSNPSEIHKEFDFLKHNLCGLVLACNTFVELDVKHLNSSLVFHHRLAPYQRKSHLIDDLAERTEVFTRILKQAGYIDNVRSREWCTLTAEADGLSIRGVISLDPVPHKFAQFMSINHEPITKDNRSELFQIINVMFDSSTFATHSHASELFTEPHAFAESCSKHYRPRFTPGRAIDRWPMFVIWIETTRGEDGDTLKVDYPSNQMEAIFDRIQFLLGSVLAEFLLSHGFARPKYQNSSFARHRESNQSRIENRGEPSSIPSNEYHAFQHWTQTRSSRNSTTHNILAGLPYRGHGRMEVPPGQTRSSFEEDASKDRTSTAIPVSDQNTTLLCSPVEISYHSDEIIQWIDPRSGCNLRIDARTGMVLSEATRDAYMETDHDNELIPKQENSSTSNFRRKRKRTLSLAQVAQNASRYSTCWSKQSDLPIRSIAPFGDCGEFSTEQINWESRRFDTFWDNLENNSNKRSIEEISQLDFSTISRRELQGAEIVNQVDKKFILVVIPSETESSAQPISMGYRLVLVDQHAADERCKVEKLLTSICQDDAVVLTDPLAFEVSQNEVRRLREQQQSLGRWQIGYEVVSKQDGRVLSEPNSEEILTPQIRVTYLPPAIAERCRLNPMLIIDLIRDVIWSDNKYSTAASTRFPNHVRQKDENVMQSSANGNEIFILPASNIPPRLVDLVNSRACRSAIMFNDELTNPQCESLVNQLSRCALPFQCAHGRPSMVVISDLSKFPDHHPLDPNYEAAGLTGLKSHFSPDGLKQGHKHVETQLMQAGSPRQACLNTIDHDDVPSFGQAYLAWIDTETESKSFV